jgi:hypothetical protein
VPGRSDGLVHLCDLPFRVDEKRLPLRDTEGEADSVELDDFAVLVRKEAERQLVLLREFPLRLDGVFRDAEDDGVLRELRAFVTEGLGFDRSTGGVGLRKEIEDDALAPQVRERHAPPVLVLQREIRSLVARLKGGAREESHRILRPSL